VCLVVGLLVSRTVSPLAGDLTATAIFGLSGLGLYLHMYYAARALAPPAAMERAEQATATLEVDEPQGSALARFALVACILAGVATVSYAMWSYEALPQRVPTHFDPAGEPDAWSDRSVASVMLLPTMNLVLCPFLAVLGWLTARAKRSVRGGTGGRSLLAQTAFRAATSRLISGIALLTCALLTYLSVQAIRVALAQTDSLGSGVWWITGALVAYSLGGLIWIASRYGQGGARIEQGSAAAPLTNGLADNAHWVWGVFYVNKNDPSILVEKRFGIGYTINFGNRTAVVLMGAFLVLIVGLIVFAAISAAG